MKRAANGEDIGILHGGKIIALRPVKVHADDYALREYGVTEQELDRFVKRTDRQLARERKAGKSSGPAAISRLILQVDFSFEGLFGGMCGYSQNRAGAKWRKQSMPSAMASGNHTPIQAWAFGVFAETISNVAQAWIFDSSFGPRRAASPSLRRVITTRSANC